MYATVIFIVISFVFVMRLGSTQLYCHSSSSCQRLISFACCWLVLVSFVVFVVV